MKLITNLFIALILSLVSYNLFAAIYQQTNANGTVTYSDIPLNSSAKQVDMSSGNKITSTATNPNTAPTKPNIAPALPTTSTQYTLFNIASPADQASIQNQVTIPVTIAIKPDLQPGDKIQLYLDGKAKGAAAASTQFQLSEIDRGTHQLSAAIINSNQQIIKQTNTITFYNHRASINSIKATKANFGGLQ